MCHSARSPASASRTNGAGAVWASAMRPTPTSTTIHMSAGHPCDARLWLLWFANASDVVVQFVQVVRSRLDFTEPAGRVQRGASEQRVPLRVGKFCECLRIIGSVQTQ